MSKSMLVNEYNKINCNSKDKIVINDIVNVSLIDVLSNNEVEVKVNRYKDCLCKSNDNIKGYYSKCNKCDGKGYINLNGHEVICNECKGEKYIRVHDCYLCNNKGKMIIKDNYKIKLKDSYRDNEELVYEFDDSILKLTLKIEDIKDYIIKGNDIYFTRGIYYSKDDYKNKTSKVVNTIAGIKHVVSEFKIKKEIVKLEGCALNGGDFYFIFDNEIENEKKEVYTNVLIDTKGYINLTDAINNEYVISRDCIAVNDNNSIYLNENINEYEDDEYVIKFNKLSKKDYIIENNKIVYLLKLDREDMENDKKVIIINDERINVSYKKNLKDEEYRSVNKVVVDKNGKKGELMIKIIPYFDNIYKISIKKNRQVVYVEDYKYDDYRLVESFKKSEYLEDYIKINDEDKIYVNSDIVCIKRV